MIYDFISESLLRLTTSRMRSWGKGRGDAGCANHEEFANQLTGLLGTASARSSWAKESWGVGRVARWIEQGW